VKLVRPRRPKTAYSPSGADFSARTNAAILWTWFTLKRGCALRVGQVKEKKILNVIDELTV
jgi:hypothetical protein